VPSPVARILTDVRYAGTSPAQGLDLYLPRSASGAPLVVLVHPGTFAEGDKREVGAVPTLLEQGYAVASVNYRLSGEARFPAAVQDVKAAIRWLRAHAGEYGIDPRRIAVWGTSAGGYLATMVGVSGGVWSGLDDVGLGNAAVSSQVQAVVSWYGPGDFTALDTQARQVAACAGRAPAHDDPGSPESRWLGGPVQTAPLTRASNPIAWLPSAPAGSLPPFLLVHGGVDCVVPSAQSTQLGQALTAAGVPTRVEIADGAGHADDSLHRRMLGPTLDFLATALRHRTPG
jgi:acetyl esterase/lipase